MSGTPTSRAAGLLLLLALLLLLLAVLLGLLQLLAGLRRAQVGGDGHLGRIVGRRLRVDRAADAGLVGRERHRRRRRGDVRLVGVLVLLGRPLGLLRILLRRLVGRLLLRLLLLPRLLLLLLGLRLLAL